MLIKNKTKQGRGVFTDILSKLSSAVTSSTAKKIGESAIKGVQKGVQSGSEELAKQGIKKLTSKVTSKKPSRKQPLATQKQQPLPPKASKKQSSTSSNPQIDAMSKMLTDGAGIITLT